MDNKRIEILERHIVATKTLGPEHILSHVRKSTNPLHHMQ